MYPTRLDIDPLGPIATGGFPARLAQVVRTQSDDHTPPASR